jgi:ech hydrogenase subunit D
MTEAMNILITPVTELVTRAGEFQRDGYRLVQICATRLKDGGYELNYTFSKEPDCRHVRVTVSGENPEVPSISKQYWAAFSYENEIHDLFGIKVTDMNIFYNGAFYKTSIPKPFSGEAGTCGVPPQNPRPSTAQKAGS